VQMAFVAQGRQADVLRITVVGAALTVILDLAVIPHWGMAGAASVTLFTELVRVVLALGWAARTGLALPGARRLARPVVATIVMAVLVQYIVPHAHVLLAVGAGGVAYVVVLLMLGAVSRVEGRMALRL